MDPHVINFYGFLGFIVGIFRFMQGSNLRPLY